jgi:hypothetical protein
VIITLLISERLIIPVTAPSPHTMAQGMKKMSGGGGRAVAKSKGSQKHKVVKAKSAGVAKGKLQKKPKRNVESSKIEHETTKAINRKNERLVAAKAVSVGTKFFMSDVAAKGENHVKKEAAQRNKRQLKSKTTSRIEKQIQELKR